MTVSSIVPVHNYMGNGSTCQFDFDFLIENESELVVTLRNKKENTQEQLIFGVDYSINEIGNKNGSFIIFPLEDFSSHSVLSPDEVITLSLNLPIKQESEFENSSTLKLDVLEWTLDYIVRILQIFDRQINRSVKIIEGDTTNPDILVQKIEKIHNSINKIETVANNTENINSVNANETNINIVATNISEINNIVDDLDKINAVNDNKININAVNSNKTNIDTVANNIDFIIESPTNANTAFQKANEASDSATLANEKAELATQQADNAEIWAEGTDEEVQALGGVHSSKGWSEVSASGQVQSNWEETDTISKAYILNKPDLSTKQDILTAGTGISIENNVISNTQTSAEWGNIEGDIENQNDLQVVLSAKQDNLTAGTNIEIVDNVISANASGLPTGSIISSLVPINDANLHLLDGSLLPKGGIYDDFINNYIKPLSSSASQCFTTESNWQSQVSQYGVCGKFVYNSSTGVRLPKVTGFVEGTISSSSLGSITEAGLPNAVGTFNNGAYTQNYSGIVYDAGDSGEATYVRGNGYGEKATIDLSRASSIYGNSDTVQPQAIKVYYYIVLGTVSKTDIQVDLDNVTTNLNNKADRDGSNFVSSIKNIDGQFVKKYSTFTATAAGEYPFDFTNFLPADNYMYEILFGIQLTYTATCIVTAYSDICGDASNPLTLAHVIGDGESNTNIVTIPVGTGRTITVNQSAKSTATTINTYGYRRIGTNQ